MATVTAVLRQLQGRYAVGAIETTTVTRSSWISPPTALVRNSSPIGWSAQRRGVVNSSHWASLISSEPSRESPLPPSTDETSEQPRFQRWQASRAATLEKSAASRWHLPEVDKALDVRVAREILHKLRADGVYDPQLIDPQSTERGENNPAVAIAGAFVQLTTIAKHPDAGWRCENEEDAIAVAQLFQDVKTLVPKHLQSNEDLRRCIDQFRHAGVWDIAQDANKVLQRANKTTTVDPVSVLDSLGSNTCVAWNTLRHDRGLGDISKKVHNWGTGSGDPNLRLYNPELWRGGRGKDPHVGDEKNELETKKKHAKGRRDDALEQFRSATGWVEMLSAFDTVPTDDSVTELVFQNLAIAADDATRFVYGDRAGYLVGRRREFSDNFSDKKARRRRRRKGKGDVSDQSEDESKFALHYTYTCDALRHVRRLVESYEQNPDANQTLMVPPIEAACVVNAFLKATYEQTVRGDKDVFEKDKNRVLNTNDLTSLTSFESSVDALFLWRAALAAGSSETGAYREKFFPHQVWQRDLNHEREVFNPAAEKFRRQVRDLVRVVGENAKSCALYQEDYFVPDTLRAARAVTSALDAFAFLAHRGIPTRRLAFDRVAACALRVVESSEAEETFSLQFDVTKTCAAASRAFQLIAERQHEGRVFDATIAKWCRVSSKMLSTSKAKPSCESLGMFIAACCSFAVRDGIADDVDALFVAANAQIADADVSGFVQNATAHDVQRVLTGWRRIAEAREETTSLSSPSPESVLTVLEATARVLPTELDPQTVHDIVCGLEALGNEVKLGVVFDAAAAAAETATTRCRKRDEAHTAASKLCLQGLRAFDEPSAPSDLKEHAVHATVATAAAAKHLEGAYIAKAARAWARLAIGARVFPDANAVAATLAALPDARPPASIADLRMIERAVLDIETARREAEGSMAGVKNKTKRTMKTSTQTTSPSTADTSPFDTLLQKWIDALPSKASAALSKKLESLDSLDAKADALVAAVTQDTTKVRAALREEITKALM